MVLFKADSSYLMFIGAFKTTVKRTSLWCITPILTETFVEYILNISIILTLQVERNIIDIILIYYIVLGGYKDV